MAEKHCRFGIMGTAGIARKNWKAIRLSGNARVAAVASRSEASAQKFIDECTAQVPQVSTPDAVGSYEALLAREDIDAVYIPLPTALRHEWVIRAAEAGKHVLGEKPAALNAQQVAGMLEACKKNNVQYMDGVMFMHSQRLPLVGELLKCDERIGQLRRMAAQFSFAGDATFLKKNIRVHSELEPYGCLGDLGWYCVRYFLCSLNGEMPTHVQARQLTRLQGTGSPGTVPGEFSAELYFASGVTASFYCSFLTENQQWFHASGSKGNLRVNDFVLPYHGSEVDVLTAQDRFEIDNCEFHMEPHSQRHAVREYDAGQATAQEVRMIRKFADLALSGKSDASWPAWTLKTQQVLDACFESSNQDGAKISMTP
ncbi:Gfo/Idh/MocA family protein [Aureliella helgolandensis]|uniref:Glucose--fructose oxidoreductase n=1 Tax=Aureliella helgolandensis TaxID=2527968 RepID=A0A518G011_9BACT|nr:Gfo/Idh/MocA family oxidoreductase [Aureliella helgolandensis]QDV21945.1 Glucose--fructose oxidoreductase precursor [Aureliella helgolandensis]